MKRPAPKGRGAPRTASRTETRTDSRTGPRSDSRTGLRPDARTSSRPDFRKGPETRTAGRSDPRSGPRTDSRPNARSEARAPARSGRPDDRAGDRARGGSRSGRPDSLTPAENWIWGFHAVEACLDFSPELILEVQVSSQESADLGPARDALAQRARDAGLGVKDVDVLPRALADKRTQGLAARLKSFPSIDLADYLDEFRDAISPQQSPRQWALLDGVQDPRNYGAILRSAAAFGIEAVFVRDRNQAPATGVVAQASAGNLFRVRTVICSNFNPVFEAASENVALVLGLEARQKPLRDLLASPENQSRSVLWVVGSEGDGIRHGLTVKCTHRVSIPMDDNVESLNASTAAAIAFYETRVQLAACAIAGSTLE